MIYDDESAEQLFMDAKRVYQDRGMMKWIGFYLSDHTAVLDKESKERNRINDEKEQMTVEEIGETLQRAYLQNKRIAIQLEALDSEGNFLDDLVGKIVGQREERIYLNEEERGMLHLEIEQIHHVEVLNPKKILSQKIIK
ncbi:MULTISPECIES: hypothetical protein [Enterococcus]|uniref:YolD-like protein n=1 Tax=Enterococcus malodoratus ATCC 43197 TaxID=1158601 RepID=R2QV68_9ENTE|nr:MULTISPECIES: hypothetical protein [Enterococcus]EOH75375.1 hypothetical protein UAI_03177 [Enterococcus malodoratus ATCC 43197]EOT66838.1 hypothetical protein I585_02359 [Enterococcus malodoratus ATCC 43197]OJG65867.1 hypothetical protein RV07_GL001454 [Enterococcus malodoratus]STD69910.1 DNA-directed RNA polymerase beta subunit [Enterococcus malodoratus]HCM87432.1 hypothetical protein [Enterococcus sp.]